MKKILCLLICSCILLSCKTTAFADSRPIESNKELPPTELSEDVVKVVSQIPMFITYIDNWEYDDIDNIKEAANQTLNIAFNNTLYQSVINLYQNTVGYFTHSETVDVNSAIASLI